MAHGHYIRRLGDDDTFRIGWVIDRKYPGSRLRFPTSYERVTDAAGALRFAKRHDLNEVDLPPSLRQADQEKSP